MWSRYQDCWLEVGGQAEAGLRSVTVREQSAPDLGLQVRLANLCARDKL